MFRYETFRPRVVRIGPSLLQSTVPLGASPFGYSLKTPPIGLLAWESLWQYLRSPSSVSSCFGMFSPFPVCMHASCYSDLKALLASRHATVVIYAVVAGNLNLQKLIIYMKLKGFEAIEHKT
eukprot:6183631-Pleurochrysis_carterae.AAC.1